MKKYIKTIMILSLMLMSAMAFAIPADPDSSPDAPAAPIEQYIYGLAVVGIVFAFWCNTKRVAKS
jgi:hypothetical protein